MPGSVLTGPPSAVSDPAALEVNVDTLALSALPANRSPRTGVTQHVADWLVAAAAIGVTVPDGFSAKLASALGPASAISRLPAGSKTTANSTVPGSELTTGAALRPPS